MKVAVFSAQPYDRRFLEEARLAHPEGADMELVYHVEPLNAGSCMLAQYCDAVCVFVNDVLDEPVLKILKALGVKAILLRCAGVDQLDLATAQQLGFFVARVPAYAPEAVAEHAVALILSLTRHIHRAFARVREGNFALDGMLGSTLHGKTVGLVGIGRIGLAAARIFHGFGCRLLACDPVVVGDFAAFGTQVSLDQLLAESDIVSLHCPLLPSTRHLIDGAALARMKPGAMLVNTSRGALIDTTAVIDALKSRHLGGLAIDVYEQEGELFFLDHSADIIGDDVFERLLSFPNVLVTGHQGFFTIEALRAIGAATIANMASFGSAASGAS